MRLKKIEFSSFEVIELGPFGFDPGFEQPGCQEHFSDPKGPIGKWSNFNPPFGTSAVNARLILTAAVGIT